MTDEIGDLPPFRPMPWWDDLNEKVRDALVACAELEGMRLEQPYAYERSESWLRRFALEHPELVEALNERYAALECPVEEPLRDREFFGLAVWMTENTVEESFLPHDTRPEEHT